MGSPMNGQRCALTHSCIVIVLVSFAFCCTAGRAYAASHEDDFAELMAIARPAAKAFSESFKASGGQRFVYHTDKIDKTKSDGQQVIAKSVSIAIVDFGKDCCAYWSRREFDKTDIRHRNTCFGINSKYSFELSSSTAHDPWKLEQVVYFVKPGGRKGDRSFPYEPPSRQASFDQAAINSILSLETVGLESLDGRPGLNVTSVKKLHNRLIELGFAYPAQPAAIGQRTYGGSTLPVVKCRLTVDTDHSYVPVTIQQTLTDGETIEDFNGTRTYVFGADGRPTERRSEYRHIGRKEDKAIFDVEEKEFVAFEYGSVPESEFTLTAFGLPEPAGVDWSWRMPEYGWALIGAGVFGLAWLIVRRARLAREKRP